MLEMIGFIFVLIGAVVLFILVNQLFDITYFGFKGIGGLFVTCIGISYVIGKLVMDAIQSILGGVFGLFATIVSVLLSILKWGLIIGCCLGIIMYIYNTYQKWKVTKMESSQGERV